MRDRRTSNGSVFPGGLLFEFGEHSDEKRGVLSSEQVGDAGLPKLELSQTLLHLLPQPILLLPFGQVKLRCQLRESLMLDRIEILVVAIDDFFLIWRVICHCIYSLCSLVCQTLIVCLCPLQHQNKEAARRRVCD